MAFVEIGGLSFDAELVAFDKDGTLIEFEFMWGRITEAWVAHLAEEAGYGALMQELYRSLGYDSERRRTVSHSPLAIAATSQLHTIAAVTLYRHGVPWPEAEDRVRAAFERVQNELQLPDLIRPAGDVAGLLARLQGAGVRVAVVTTDDRAETEETLRLMKVAHLVDQVVCGDDGWPVKPAPDMLLAACQRLGVAPGQTVVVGDTLGDLLMAQRAGAGLRAAVLTGPGDRTELAAHADVVLQSIDDISVRKTDADLC